MVSCSCCATVLDVERPPLSWSSTVEDGVISWLCEACSRTHLRAMEGKLDREWW